MEMNFMYEPPPGCKKPGEGNGGDDEDNEPRFEWQVGHSLFPSSSSPPSSSLLPLLLVFFLLPFLLHLLLPLLLPPLSFSLPFPPSPHSPLTQRTWGTAPKESYLGEGDNFAEQPFGIQARPHLPTPHLTCVHLNPCKACTTSRHP